MTLIKPISDIHGEFNPTWTLPKCDKEKETILVLAGDIGLAKSPSTYRPFVEDCANRFKQVIYILGNHEHYQGKFPTSHTRIWTELIEFDNVHVLEKESHIVDDVAFICATLWTDMDNRNALCIEQSRVSMNDYNLIRTGPIEKPWQRPLHPHDTIVDHENAKHFIFEEIKKQKAAGNKVVVVIHHCPSYKSVPNQFIGDIINGAYVTELFNDIIDLGDDQPEFFIHGHTHTSFDYMIGNSRVVCNPYGYYPNEINKDFNVNLILEI